MSSSSIPSLDAVSGVEIVSDVSGDSAVNPVKLIP